MTTYGQDYQGRKRKYYSITPYGKEQLPIVRETGGLRDTVEPYNEYENTGCGFSFANFNAQEMADIVRYAYRVEHEQKAAWKELIYRAMDRNFSWNASAHAYEKLYDKLVEM